MAWVKETGKALRGAFGAQQEDDAYFLTGKTWETIFAEQEGNGSEAF